MGLLSIVGSIAGAVLGGPTGAAIGGSIGGSLDASSAAKDATGAQVSAANYAAALQKQAADASLAFQKQMYGDSLKRQEPWYNAGVDALKRIQSGLSPGGEFTTKFTGQTLYDDPSYKWRVEQGQKALEQSAAAKGIQFTGGAQAALQDYGQKSASLEYQAAYNRFYADQDRALGRLGGLASAGSTTAGNLASLGSTLGTNVGNTLTNSAQQQASWLAGGANAAAAGYVQQANIGNALTGNLLNQVNWGDLFKPQDMAMQVQQNAGDAIYTPSQNVWG